VHALAWDFRDGWGKAVNQLVAVAKRPQATHSYARPADPGAHNHAAPRTPLESP
jgi:hypothetical protein